MMKKSIKSLLCAGLIGLAAIQQPISATKCPKCSHEWTEVSEVAKQAARSGIGAGTALASVEVFIGATMVAALCKWGPDAVKKYWNDVKKKELQNGEYGKFVADLIAEVTPIALTTAIMTALANHAYKGFTGQSSPLGDKIYDYSIATSEAGTAYAITRVMWIHKGALKDALEHITKAIIEQFKQGKWFNGTAAIGAGAFTTLLSAGACKKLVEDAVRRWSKLLA